MAKWKLPEGRKPLTDADIAALTRRLAGTAVDYKELYEASKRDAEEAEAYAAELEAKLKLADEIINLQADRLEELEAKNKRLNEQMDAIEEMGTESLNALPDCLMRLAPALVENDELKAKLAIAVEALEYIKDTLSLYSAKEALTKIKGEA
jgi:methionine synthase II (cobalamin-independent)